MDKELTDFLDAYAKDNPGRNPPVVTKNRGWYTIRFNGVTTIKYRKKDLVSSTEYMRFWSAKGIR